MKQFLDDATPAIAVAILLFLMPSEPSFLRIKDWSSLKGQYKASPPLIDWKTAEKRLPWGIILLLGGGFALAAVSEVGISCPAKIINITRARLQLRKPCLVFIHFYRALHHLRKPTT